MFNAQEFAVNLKQSTLDTKTQEVILAMLPNLSLEQIDEIDFILKKDKKERDLLWKKLELKMDLAVKEGKKILEAEQKKEASKKE